MGSRGRVVSVFKRVFQRKPLYFGPIRLKNTKRNREAIRRFREMDLRGILTDPINSMKVDRDNYHVTPAKGEWETEADGN